MVCYLVPTLYFRATLPTLYDRYLAEAAKDGLEGTFAFSERQEGCSRFHSLQHSAQPTFYFVRSFKQSLYLANRSLSSCLLFEKQVIGSLL